MGALAVEERSFIWSGGGVGSKEDMDIGGRCCGCGGPGSDGMAVEFMLASGLGRLAVSGVGVGWASFRIAG